METSNNNDGKNSENNYFLLFPKYNIPTTEILDEYLKNIHQNQPNKNYTEILQFLFENNEENFLYKYTKNNDLSETQEVHN